MPDFMYLHRGQGNQQPATPPSPEEMKQMMQKFMVWTEAMKKGGHLKDPGAQLERKGKLVHGGNKGVTDGPFAEAKDVVGGYMILTAKDMDEAGGLLKDAQFLGPDGLIEVRPIRPM